MKAKLSPAEEAEVSLSLPNRLLPCGKPVKSGLRILIGGLVTELLTILRIYDPVGRFGHFSERERLARAKPMQATPQYTCQTSDTNKPRATAS